MSGNFNKTGFPMAKDPSGVPQLVCLDAEGRLPVTSEAPGVCYITPFACIDLTENGGTPDEVLIGEIDVNLTMQYESIGWSVSTNIDAIWTICRVDDATGVPVETVVHKFITNPAAPHSCCDVHCLGFNTTGGTGTQRFRLKCEAVDANCLGPAMGVAWTKEVPA